MPTDIEARNLTVGIGLRTSDLDRQIGDVQRRFKRLGKDIERTGQGLTKAFTVPIAAIGAASIAAANQFDKSFADIRRGTGATGKNLAELKNVFLDVNRNVANSTRETGQAIADLNTRLGLSGDTLEAVATQTLNLARITDTNLGSVVESTTRVIGDWGIETERVGYALDFLFKTSQSTGIGIDKLGRQLVQYGAPLRQFGFSFEEAAALMGKFEKEGVNAELVFSGLRQSIARFADAGIPLKEGLREIIERIQQAGSATEATGIAMKVFGARGGSDMAAAIREGKFEIGELVDALTGSTETINKAAAESETFSEKLQLLKKNVIQVLEPLGSTILSELAPLLDNISSGVQNVGEWFSNLSPEVKQTVVQIAALVALTGPLTIGFGKIVGAVGGMIGKVKLAHVELLLLAESIRIIVNLLNDLEQEKTFDYLAAENTARSMRGLGNEAEKTAREILALTINGKKNADVLSKIETRLQKVTRAMQENNPTDQRIISGYDKLTKAVNEYRESLNKVSEEEEKSGEATEETAGKVNKSVAEIQAAIDQMLKGKGGVGGIGKAAKDDLESIQKTLEKGGEVNSALVEAHENAVEAWRNTFQDAITGVRFDLENALEQVAVGFAAEIAASVFGGVSAGIKGPADVGGLVAQLLGFGSSGTGTSGISGIGGGGGGLIGSIFTGGLTGRAPGVEGPLLQDGSFATETFAPGTNASAALDTAGLAIAAANAADALGRFGDSTEDTARSIATLGGGAAGFAIGGPVGAAVGSSLGNAAGALLGSVFGGGPKDPGTIARIEASDQINSFLNEIGGINFFNQGRAGRVESVNGRLFDDFSSFDAERDLFGKFGDDSQAFLGAGRGLAEILGIKDLDGSHLGVILAQAFDGGTEALKAFLNAFGVGADQIQEELLKIAKTGDITWHEFEVQLQAVNGALEPGIKGVGKFEEAMANLLKTGARGQIALDQLRALAIEAQEAGLDIHQLEQRLRESGQFSEETINATFQALNQRGVGSIDDLANASDRVLGGVIADMVSLGVQFQDTFQQVQDVTNAINSIPDVTEKSIHFNVTASVTPEASAVLEGTPTEASVNALGNVFSPGGLEKFAYGGIVHKPTAFKFGAGRLGIMGEAGSEGILPLKRMSSGHLGVRADLSGGSARPINVNVYAPNAQAGAGEEIYRMLMVTEERAVNRAVNTIADYYERGN